MSESKTLQPVSIWTTLIALGIIGVEISALSDPSENTQGWPAEFCPTSGELFKFDLPELGEILFHSTWNGPRVTLAIGLDEDNLDATAMHFCLKFRFPRRQEEPGKLEESGITWIVAQIGQRMFRSQPITLSIGDDLRMTSQDSPTEAETFATLAIGRAFHKIFAMGSREVSTKYGRGAALHAKDFGFGFQGNPHDALSMLKTTRTLLDRLYGKEDLYILYVRQLEAVAMRVTGMTKQAITSLEDVFRTTRKQLGDNHVRTLEVRQDLGIALLYGERELEGISHLGGVANGFASLGLNDHCTGAKKWSAFGCYLCGDLPESQRRYEEVKTLALASGLERLVVDANVGLANIHYQNQDFDLALQLYQSASEWRSNNNGPRHSDTLYSIKMAARCFWGLGRTEEAKGLFYTVIDRGFANQHHVVEAKNLLDSLQMGDEVSTSKTT
ncbi:hypothetical protein FALBO_11792 [Fusarium albosuccineum]|uniref:Tetratricopeptide repeat protein n=1 Tax=Fusarium albosuccineum TaxID=1237068 RepID=A0A8H4L577_9HYPO|nr:hypothetical protein FALBO_11792 [Fusarium albosuccineum]